MISPEFKVFVLPSECKLKAKMITTRKLLLEGIVKKFKSIENSKTGHSIPQTNMLFSQSSPVILTRENKPSNIDDLVDIGRLLASKVVDISYFDVPAFESLLDRVCTFFIHFTRFSFFCGQLVQKQLHLVNQSNKELL